MNYKVQEVIMSEFICEISMTYTEKKKNFEIFVSKETLFRRKDRQQIVASSFWFSQDKSFIRNQLSCL